MNDFTKNELDMLLNGLNELRFNTDHCDSDLFSLLQHLTDKVENMIDNYCEHNQHTPVLGDLNAYQCDSCNEIILR